MTTQRTFDRLKQYDEKSRSFNVRAVLPSITPRSYTWRCDARLDQGVEGACVGFSTAHELAARPVPVSGVTNQEALKIYREARLHDEWEGEDYEGTSVLAGMKLLKSWGYYSEYRWAFNLNDALAAISRHGPAVLGCWWYESMFDTDNEGRLHVDDTAPVGGHAILVNGVSVRDQTVTLHNSWGASWGVLGEAKVSWDEFEFLMMYEGELAVPVYRTMGDIA